MLTSKSSPAVVLDSVANASADSMYYSVVKIDATLYTRGYGGHGNLGHGNRRSFKSPKLVLPSR